MSCDNCDCAKCKLARRFVEKTDEKSSRPLGPHEQCQCGRPKYWDAICCDVCWSRGDGYDDRR